MTRGRTAVIALLAGVAAINFLWMPGEFAAGDPNAWREETRSLLLAGELHVPRWAAQMSGERGAYFVENERSGLYYSKFGLANSLLAAPPMLLDRALGRSIAQPGLRPTLLYANLWNLAMCVALAALLYSLAGAYSQRAAVRTLFIIGALYCTALWFYQRAQNSEIYQTIFFTAFFMALLGFLRPLAERGPGGLERRAWLSLGVAWACVALLLFTRVLYGLLIPLVVLLAAYCAARGGAWVQARLVAALLVPPVLMVALLGLVNYVKFGAPWLTGYHQWHPEAHYPTGRLGEGLWGFLFSPRFSMFLYFPLLVFALIGLRRFVARHRLDALAIGVVFGAFLMWLSMTPTWAGEWSYGPRYLIPMLPVLSLPFLTFADGVVERIATWSARAWALAALATLAFSAHLQTQVNRLPFWIYYKAREAMAVSRSPAMAEYFLERHTGLIADDLVKHRSNPDALPYFADLRRDAPARFVQEYRNSLAEQLERGNLYWALAPGQRR